MPERFIKIFCYHSNTQCENIISDSLPAIFHHKKNMVHTFSSAPQGHRLGSADQSASQLHLWALKQKKRRPPGRASLNCRSISWPAWERELPAHHRTRSCLLSWAASCQFAWGFQSLKVHKMGWWGKHSCQEDLSAKCQLRPCETGDFPHRTLSVISCLLS